jgi:P2X purinoceptor 4
LPSNIPKERIGIYERIWDGADYVIPPSENEAFFIMTNVVITPDQIRGNCPEDHSEIPPLVCHLKQTNSNRTNNLEDDACEQGRIFSYKSHGRETGNCIKSDRDRDDEVYTCEITGWCPVELDVFPKVDRALIQGTENFTVFIKNAISFPWFDGTKYRRNNLPNGICIYNPNDESTWMCPIFRLGDIVELAGG